jgi:glycosyltransferase involved in cell wall biosynthesis
MKISYAITACNEHEELDKLLHHLLTYKQIEDEVVVQIDSKHTPEIIKVIGTHIDNIRVVYFSLNNDFALFKNNLKDHCVGDYIFQIDADEIPSIDLLTNIHKILEDNPIVDMMLVPRINTVAGLTQEHIEKWGWNINKQGWVNFPDYQTRIYKNKPNINWNNKIHERLFGFTTHAALPSIEEYCLYHPKTIERQEKQNERYSKIETGQLK